MIRRLREYIKLQVKLYMINTTTLRIYYIYILRMRHNISDHSVLPLNKS